MKTKAENTQEPQKETVQRVQQEPSTGGEAMITDNRPATTMQRKLSSAIGGAENRTTTDSIQRKTSHESSDSVQEPPSQRNNTGLPDKLKSGIENLSGYSMDDVKVHYNSSKPAQLQAHAYAQGTDIHLAPGQQKHLPHEAWHVVQQKQGRVKPTMQFKGKVNINDDAGLEREADLMGKRAESCQNRVVSPSIQERYNSRVRVNETTTYQLVFYPANPTMGERHMIDGLISYGILDFIGRDGRQVDTFRDKNYGNMGVQGPTLTPINYLGGGAQKVAYGIDNSWVLLTHRQKTPIEDEIRELLRIESLGARIPAMMKVTRLLPGMSAEEEYILTTSIKERDFKEESINRQAGERTRELSTMAKAQGNNQPNIEQILRPGVERNLRRGTTLPTEAEMEEQLRIHTQQRIRYMGQLADQNYWLPDDARTGFIQQKIIGTELGKNTAQNQRFKNAVLNQDQRTRGVSMIDLQRVWGVLQATGAWGDFALFHETATGHIYVFDPDPTVGNGNRDPKDIVRKLISRLMLQQ